MLIFDVFRGCSAPAIAIEELSSPDSDDPKKVYPKESFPLSSPRSPGTVLVPSFEPTSHGPHFYVLTDSPSLVQSGVVTEDSDIIINFDAHVLRNNDARTSSPLHGSPEKPSSPGPSNSGMLVFVPREGELSAADVAEADVLEAAEGRLGESEGSNVDVVTVTEAPKAEGEAVLHLSSSEDETEEKKPVVKGEGHFPGMYRASLVS